MAIVSSTALGPFIEVMTKLFFILTPFFVLSMFITMTDGMGAKKQHRIAEKTTIAIIVICFFFYFLGSYVFAAFGLTLDAFRIGAGAILFRTAVDLVKSEDKDQNPDPARHGDISVVPMAIPFAIGPGTIGMIMVTSAESRGMQAHAISCLGIVAACTLVGLLLYCSSWVERLVGKGGIRIFSKLTGLILAAMAAQMIFTGIKNFFR